MNTLVKEYYAALDDNLPTDVANLKQYITCRGKLAELTRPDGTIVRKWKLSQYWATLEGACFAAMQHGLHVGLVLSKDCPYDGMVLAVIDLDHCRNNPKAREIIDKIRSYTEVSMGGDGYHILVWVKGTDYQYICGKRQIKVEGLEGSDIRFYDNYTVLTGNQVYDYDMSSINADELENMLGITFDVLPTTDDMVESIEECGDWEPITDGDDDRWRTVIAAADFDVDLMHLLANRIRRQNKLVALPHEDESGSGIAFRLLLRVWDIFTNPADLMAVYDYAYRCATNGKSPTKSSVRASVWKILAERKTALEASESINTFIQQAENEMQQENTASAENDEPEPQDYGAWRDKFYAITGATGRIVKFYQEPWSSKYYIEINNKGVKMSVYTDVNLFYPASFKSKIAPQLGVNTKKSAMMIEAACNILQRCMGPVPQEVVAYRLWNQVHRDMDELAAWQQYSNRGFGKSLYHIKRVGKEWKFAHPRSFKGNKPFLCTVDRGDELKDDMPEWVLTANYLERVSLAQGLSGSFTIEELSEALDLHELCNINGLRILTFKSY